MDYEKFSHIQHKSILGYKCLTLLLSDGMSRLFLDFSLHGEEGRKPEKKQGLTDKQRSERFSADYTGQSVEERIREYTMKKTDKAIEMVKYAIRRGIRFDYLLVDSWFTCADFVKLITSRHIKCHLIGMIKLGKTKYHTKWGDLTANQIIARLQKQGVTKHNKTLKCTYCTIDVKFAGTTVRLFFSKRGGKDSGTACSPRTSRSASLRHTGLMLLVGLLRWHITIVSNCLASENARASTSPLRLQALR